MMKHFVDGCVMQVSDIDTDTDRVHCLVWFNGQNGDNSDVCIDAKAGTFQVRDLLRIEFHKVEKLTEK